MFMRSLFALGALASMSLSVGCAVGNTDTPDAEAQISTSATGIVVVERTGVGDAVVARFVRARQGIVDDAALRTAGVQDVPAPGTCVTSIDQPAASARAVELLDVGAVHLDAFASDAAQPKTTILFPRAMPDPAGVVSGYFYSARAPEAFTPMGRVSLRASGGPDLPEGFTVSVPSPRDLADLRVAATGASVDVLWDATESDARDLVYADVLAPSMIARCAATDAGHLAIPASALGAAEEGTIAVHRVHREAFKTRGIDPGEVRFDLARVVSFRR